MNIPSRLSMLAFKLGAAFLSKHSGSPLASVTVGFRQWYFLSFPEQTVFTLPALPFSLGAQSQFSSVQLLSRIRLFATP